MDRQHDKRSNLQQTLDAVLDSSPFGVLMVLATLFSLFGEDVRVAAMPRSSDSVFLLITGLVIALFAIEMLLIAATRDEYLLHQTNSLGGRAGSDQSTVDKSFDQEDRSPREELSPTSAARKGESAPFTQRSSLSAGAIAACGRVVALGARAVGTAGFAGFRAMLSIGSFQFWIDSIALASMALDVVIIVEDLQPGFGGPAPLVSSDSASRAAFISVARAGRASRAGARATRLLRMFQIFAKMGTIKSDKLKAEEEGMRKGAPPPAPALSSGSPPAASPRSPRVTEKGAGGSISPPGQAPSLEVKSDKENALGQWPSMLVRWRTFQLRYEEARLSVMDVGETRVGSRLMEIMTQRVVLGVLILVLAVPMLTYQPVDVSKSFAVLHTHAFALLTAADNNTFSPALQQATIVLSQMMPTDAFAPWQLAAVDVNGSSLASLLPVPPSSAWWESNIRPQAELRRGELSKGSCSGSLWWNLSAGAYIVPDPSFVLQNSICTQDLNSAPSGKDHSAAAQVGAAVHAFTTRMWFDTRALQRSKAINNVVLTVVILLIIASGSALFTLATQRLVLHPLAKLVLVVQRLTANPLASPMELLVGTGKGRKGPQTLLFAADSHELYGVAGPEDPSSLHMQSIAAQLRGKGSSDGNVQALSARALALADDGEEATETRLLLRSLLNMGPLLRAGFGTSGARTITANLNRNGELLPTRHGKLVHAIFMHVHIRHIQELIEDRPAGQAEEVVLLINAVLIVVHRVATAHGARVLSNDAEGTTLAWVLPSPCAEAVLLPDGRSPWTSVADTARLVALRIQVELARLSIDIVGSLAADHTVTSLNDDAEEEDVELVVSQSDSAVSTEALGILPSPSPSIPIPRLPIGGERDGRAAGLPDHASADDPQPDHLLSWHTRKILHGLLYRDWLSSCTRGIVSSTSVFGPDASTMITAALHAGWGVECAIGSDKKLGAGIVGPHTSVPALLSAWADGGDQAVNATAGMMQAQQAADTKSSVLAEDAQAMQAELESDASLPPLSLSVRQTSSAEPVLDLPYPFSSLSAVLLTHTVAALLSPSVLESCVTCHALRPCNGTSLSGEGLPIGFEPWAVPILSTERGGGGGRSVRGDDQSSAWDVSALSSQLLGCDSAWADQVRMLATSARSRDSWRGTLVLYAAGAHPSTLAAVARSGSEAHIIASARGGYGPAAPGLPSLERLAATSKALYDELPNLPDPHLSWPTFKLKSSVRSERPNHNEEAAVSVGTSTGGGVAGRKRSFTMGSRTASFSSSSGDYENNSSCASWSSWDAALTWSTGAPPRQASRYAPSIEARDMVRLSTCVHPLQASSCLGQAVKLLLGRGGNVGIGEGPNDEVEGMHGSAAVRTAVLEAVKGYWPAALPLVSGVLLDTTRSVSGVLVRSESAAAAVLCCIAWRVYGMAEGARLLALMYQERKSRLPGQRATGAPLLPASLLYSQHPDGISQRSALLDVAIGPLPSLEEDEDQAPDHYDEELQCAP